MDLFGGAIQISGITYQLFVVFAVILAGYLIGKIEIKGISLGTAGVFVAALLFGIFFGTDIHQNLTFHGDDITSNAFMIVENAGLILFLGSVGLMAGPGFFTNFKKNIKSYVLIGVIIIITGVLISLACFYAGMANMQVPSDAAAQGITENQYMISVATGIMTGSLTSSPSFAAAQTAVASLVSGDAADTLQDVITTGHAVAYFFGVIGVVLFVQLIPRFLKADMKTEREKIAIVDDVQSTAKSPVRKWFEIDRYGFAAFALVVIIGIFIGNIRVPLSDSGLSGTTFSLTLTGGVLISGLIFGHFGHIGPISINTDRHVLKVFREFGLIFFLVGVGIPGGISFVQNFHPVYFIYGIIITIVPMFIALIFGRKIIKLPLLNTLGSITGGMTCTPSLGALIKTSGTDDVAASYAATYPVALVCMVLATQFMILIFGGAV